MVNKGYFFLLFGQPVECPMNPEVESAKLVPIEDFARLASDEQINRSALAQEVHGITQA